MLPIHSRQSSLDSGRQFQHQPQLHQRPSSLGKSTKNCHTHKLFLSDSQVGGFEIPKVYLLLPLPKDVHLRCGSIHFVQFFTIQIKHGITP